MNNRFAIADNIKLLKEQYMLFAYSQNQLKIIPTALHDKIQKSIIEERKIHLNLNIRVLKKEFPYLVHNFSNTIQSAYFTHLSTSFWALSKS